MNISVTILYRLLNKDKFLYLQKLYFLRKKERKLDKKFAYLKI